MANIWAETLKLKQIGIYDNFFDLGRRSCLAMEVISRVRKVFAIDVALRELFAAPTVAGMAATMMLKRATWSNRKGPGGAMSDSESTPSQRRQYRSLKD